MKHSKTPTNGIKSKNYFNILPHDTATIIYFFIVILIVLIGYHKLEKPLLHISFHIAGILFITVLAKLDTDNNRIIKFFHYFYPITLFTFIYQETGRLNQIFFTGYFDAFLLHFDELIFNQSPLFWLYSAFPQRWISEYFHFSYAFYYLMVPLTFLYIYFFADKKVRYNYLLEYMFTLCFSFYIYYFTFIIFPAVGGRTFVDIYSREGYVFKKIVDIIYLTQEIDGGAFPSSHVGIAIICLLNLKKIKGFFYRVMLILVPSLAIATVYCGYHYGVDMIFGALTGILYYAMGMVILKKWGMAPLNQKSFSISTYSSS